MNKRIGPIAAALVLAATGLVASGTPSGAVAPAITLSATSVQVGKTFSASAVGCTSDSFDEDGPTFTYRRADIVLITVTPSGERLAAGGDGGDGGDLTVPGWVDPADPALVTGRCQQTTYDTHTGTRTDSVSFTFADVPIDITPGVSPRTPVLTLARTTAAGGQVIPTVSTGCGGTDYATVTLLRGGDITGRTPTEFVTSSNGSDESPVADTIVGELTLNDRAADYEGSGYGAIGGPLAEGDYVAVLLCQIESSTTYTTVLSAPQVVHVVGTNPSGSMMVSVTDDDQVAITGEGCTGDQPVTVHVEGYRFGSPFLSEMNSRAAALQVGDRAAAFGPVGEDDNTFGFDETVTAEADGTWTYSFAAPTDSFELSVTADCGDPTVDGFRYSNRYLSEDHTAEIDFSRISPTSSPVGGQVTAHGYAYCGIDRDVIADGGSMDDMDDMADGAEHMLTVQLVDRTGTVLSESPAQLSEQYRLVSGTVTAPSTPGEYFLVGTCDGERGYPTPYDVFAPTTLADPAPAVAEPSTGWPRTGSPETYNGRVGPISLPAMDMGMGSDDADMAGGVAHAASAGSATTTVTGAPIAPLPPGGLGPSGLFVDVPRPEGDFAITKMSISLVDAQGNDVSPEMAHLHHFVIGNDSGVNPACPDNTFGIPGEIVAAAGAERTALDTGEGPYGIVVKGSDVWKGVYMLMSRSMTDQQVFLSYDMEYRRDVANVRPLTPYFGSATGCGTFNWPIDGSGTPDVQSHYVTIAKDGLLLGTGAHFHNGGSYADMTDDRGRRLCRSVMNLKNETIGHGDMHGGMNEYEPPEFYPDDKVIDGITNCQLHEKVKAGERLRFDAAYANDRARSGVMGIYTFYVWEGGGPAGPDILGADRTPTRRTTTRGATGARAVSGRPNYAG